MSESSKIFPPSDLKLERLRREGVVPYSQEFNTAAFFIGISAAIFVFVYLSWEPIWKFFNTSFAASQLGRDELGDSMRDAVQLVLSKTALVLVLTSLIVLLCGLYQTKFLLRFQLLAPSFARVFDFSRVVKSLSFGHLGKAVVGLTKGILWVSLAAICIRQMVVTLIHIFPEQIVVALRQIVQASSNKAASNSQFIKVYIAKAFEVLSGVLIWALVFLLLLGVLSRIIVMVSYFRRHQMTRAEVDAEAKEMDVSPQIHQERRERLQQDS